MDAITGLPWISAAIGLVAAGATAILMPGHDPAPVIAGIETLATAIESHKSDLDKATVSASETTPESLNAAALWLARSTPVRQW